ncbi:MAG: 5-formyltetrahydrofolate cyclo-ligase [Sulfuriferula sp.]|nr:5-formyltetrahydrofolate cyclo-ligase [Sulfuriferula sp.]
MQASKSQLRRQLLQRRRALTAMQRHHAAQQLLIHVIRSRLLLRHQHIGLYLAHGTEINTLPLINRLLALGKTVYLPALPFGRSKQLWFHRIEAHQPWHVNQFGIPENQTSVRVRARQLDVLFMPLVGYDDAGSRIGMGGGYYDASLAYLRRRRYHIKPRLIGIAFTCQHLTLALPADSWDVPLHGILTEQNLRYFR